MDFELNELIAAIESGDEDASWDSSSEIVRIGPPAAAAVPALIWTLKSGNYSEISNYVTGMAADALAAIGPAAIDAVEALELLTIEKPNLPEEGRWLRLRAATAH